MDQFWKYQLFIGYNMMHALYTLLSCVERAVVSTVEQLFI